MAKPKRTQAQKDRMKAQQYANSTASPYRKAARATEDDAARGMTDAQIDQTFGSSYDAATASAGLVGGNATTGASNATSILTGLVGALPGSNSYDVTGLLSDYSNANTANAELGKIYQASLQADIGTARNAGLAMARGRRDERSDKLGAEARALRMQGNVAAADTLTPLNNIIATRAARQNLALLRLQTEAQRLANENAGRGGGSGGGSGSGSGGGGRSGDGNNPMSNLTADQISSADPSGGAGTGYGGNSSSGSGGSNSGSGSTGSSGNGSRGSSASSPSGARGPNTGGAGYNTPYARGIYGQQESDRIGANLASSYGFYGMMPVIPPKYRPPNRSTYAEDQVGNFSGVRGLLGG